MENPIEQLDADQVPNYMKMSYQENLEAALGLCKPVCKLADTFLEYVVGEIPGAVPALSTRIKQLKELWRILSLKETDSSVWTSPLTQTPWYAACLATEAVVNDIRSVIMSSDGYYCLPNSKLIFSPTMNQYRANCVLVGAAHVSDWDLDAKLNQYFLDSDPNPTPIIEVLEA